MGLPEVHMQNECCQHEQMTQSAAMHRAKLQVLLDICCKHAFMHSSSVSVNPETQRMGFW